MDAEKVGFGGGCHWCTEAVFQAMDAASHVSQGFIQSVPPADTWSEAVIVSFDPAQIRLETLVDIHIQTHAATKSHSMRSKYRSAIYTFSDAQASAARNALTELQSQFDAPLITQVLPFVAFKPSDERFHNYYQTNPERPFCKRYIDPKLAKLKTLHSDPMA